MKLFAIYIGGSVENSNIELHDIRFVIANHIDDTYDELRKQWWGVPESLHIDCWMEVIKADGYKITLKNIPAVDSKKLYFVNLGGYDGKDFSELHKNLFVVEEREQKAQLKAIKAVREWKAFHRDYMYEVESSFCLDKIAAEKSLYIHLEPIEDQSQPEFTCFYKPVGKKKDIKPVQKDQNQGRLFPGS